VRLPDIITHLSVGAAKHETIERRVGDILRFHVELFCQAADGTVYLVAEIDL
jgi:hypothetical protein